MPFNVKHSLALALLAIVFVNTSAGYGQYNKMMVVGNSLTHHSPRSGADGLNWDGDWGMAASTQANDYVHRLQSMLQADQMGTPLGLEVGHIADERYTLPGPGVGCMNLSGAPTLTASNADLMFFQLGENYVGPLTWEAFGQNYKTTIQEVAAGGNNPKLYIVGPWWESRYTYKSLFIQRVAYELGATYVHIQDLSQNPVNLGTSEPYAAPSWATNGVGAHPGDTGMARIAERIYGAVTAPDPIVRTPNGPNLLSNGNFEDVSVPAGTSVPTSSVDMHGWGQTGTNPELVSVGGVFDRTGDDFLAMSQASSLFQAAQEIQANKKYTFLVDYGYSVNWFNLADGAFAAISEFDSAGTWICDLALADTLTSNQSGIANQVFLEYITGENITAGHRIGVRLGIDSTPIGGCGVLWDNASLTVVDVPEPASMILLATGVLALLCRKK